MYKQVDFNNLNTKVIVLFPFNTDNTNIWTDDLQFKTDDTTSYLGINYKYKILNDVVSREPIVDDRIIVPQSRTIKLEFVPTKPLYNGISSDGTVLTSDISLNKFEIVIPTNDSGYTVDEFIKELNDGFDNTNVLFTDNHNTSIFNNDYMRLRLAQLPILNTECDVIDLEPKFWQTIDYSDPKRERHEKEKNIVEGLKSIIDKRTLDYGMEMGKISGELIKSRLPFPHDLEYEKTFWPFPS